MLDSNNRTYETEASQSTLSQNNDNSSFFVPNKKYINNNIEYAILNINGMNFIQVYYRSKILNFLLDTGARVSVIFLECIQGYEHVDTSKSIKIKGIGGLTSALGTTNIFFTLNNNDISYTFLVTKTFSSGIDGILGSDFFSKYKAAINYETNLFLFNLHNKKTYVSMYCVIVTISRSRMLHVFSTKWNKITVQ